MSSSKSRRHIDNFIKRTLNNPDWAISVLLELKHERQRRELAEAQLEEVLRVKTQIANAMLGKYRRI